MVALRYDLKPRTYHPRENPEPLRQPLNLDYLANRLQRPSPQSTTQSRDPYNPLYKPQDKPRGQYAEAEAKVTPTKFLPPIQPVQRNFSI